MRAQYELSKLYGRRNPYIKCLKQPVTIRLDKNTVAYFKELSDKVGMPYKNLINLYLRDCAFTHKRLHLKWS